MCVFGCETWGPQGCPLCPQYLQYLSEFVQDQRLQDIKTSHYPGLHYRSIYIWKKNTHTVSQHL